MYILTHTYDAHSRHNIVGIYAIVRVCVHFVSYIHVHIVYMHMLCYYWYRVIPRDEIPSNSCDAQFVAHALDTFVGTKGTAEVWAFVVDINPYCRLTKAQSWSKPLLYVSQCLDHSRIRVEKTRRGLNAHTKLHNKSPRKQQNSNYGGTLELATHSNAQIPRSMWMYKYVYV